MKLETRYLVSYEIKFRREVNRFAFFCFPPWTVFVHAGVGGFDTARFWVQIRFAREHKNAQSNPARGRRQLFCELRNCAASQTGRSTALGRWRQARGRHRHRGKPGREKIRRQDRHGVLRSKATLPTRCVVPSALRRISAHLGGHVSCAGRVFTDARAHFD